MGQALQKMVEDAGAAIPDGNGVELIETKTSRDAPQESFIRLCNQEMSKALTSQTMATEQSKGGSRGAGLVAREREESVDSSQRVIVEATMNKLFSLITQFNIPNAKPPVFKFFEKDTAPTAWVDVLKEASEFMDISKKFAHKMTGISEPENDDDLLKSKTEEVAEFAEDKNI